MKQCPRCNQTYTDDQLNFCLNDGEMLVSSYAGSQRPFDDSPPTVMMNDPRSTNPTNWQAPAAPPAQWQGQQVMSYPISLAPNQTLAVTSLCFGIASITVGWCCYLGVLLAPVAMITGFISISQIKSDPRSYTGRGLAIGGIVTGLIYFAALLLIIILYGAAIFLGSLGN